jgi:hypothetical protein
MVGNETTLAIRLPEVLSALGPPHPSAAFLVVVVVNQGLYHPQTALPLFLEKET